MKAKYFVDYFAYFGEVAHETFKSMAEMQFFLRQLREGAVLGYGEIQKEATTGKEAA